MQNRLKLLMGATALLYFGPLLAGLAGFGWAVVPVFVAIFILWLLILRPQEWPRTWADWQRPEALVALAARAAVQVLLVVVCFGIGRGIGGVLGALPPFPTMLPIAISFLSIPLARMIWDPWKAGKIDAFLSNALDQIAPDADADTRRLAAMEMADRMVQPLADLPGDTAEPVLAGHLAALAPHLSEDLMFAALLARAENGASRAAQKAAVVLATDPANALQGAEAPTKVLAVLGDDAELLALFATRCTALLQANPAAWGDCPTPDVLEQAAAAVAGPAAQALRDLAGLTRSRAPVDDDAF